MTEALTTDDLTIENVKLQFDQWRASRSHKLEPIPQPLWLAAAALCRTHRITHVCRHLRLSFADLKKHLAPNAPPAFFELNAGGLFGQWQLTCERADGARLHVRAAGQPPAFDVLIRQFLA
jgi:hypothetical protein